MSQLRPRQAALADGLTPRQAEVLRLIVPHLLREGRPPTLRWLTRRLGTAFPSGALCHLTPLVKKGVITRDVSSPGGIRLCGLRLRLDFDRSAASERLRRVLGEGTFEQGGGI